MTDNTSRRRLKRQISDVTDPSPESSGGESEEDFDPRQAEAMRRAGKQDQTRSSARAATNVMSSQAGMRGHTSTAHDPNRHSIKLTMKVPPSKLREVMRVSEIDSLRDTLGGGQVINTPRSSRRAAAAQPRVVSGRAGGRPKYAEALLSDEEGDDDAEDTRMHDYDDTELGGPEEDDDEDENDDVEMANDATTQGAARRAPAQPKAPKITLKTPAKTEGKAQPKPKVVVSPAKVGPVKSVEEQEIEDDDDGEDESIGEEEDETNLDDEDAEGEDELVEEDEDEEVEAEEDLELQTGLGGEEGDDMDEDEEDDEDSLGSGAATPDPSKMTARQRGRALEPLLSLDMAPQQRKFFTDAEKAMKKDEHARKRKELTKRKVQEEKNAALNRLLKPQVTKTRGAAPKAETLAAQLQSAAAADEEEEAEKADPLYTRWISSKDGIKLGVPEEWLGKHAGRCFGPPLPPKNGALVQEIE